MDIDVAFWGHLLFLNMIAMLIVTSYLARHKAVNLPLVGFCSALASLLCFPLGWLYCVYWLRKPQLAQAPNRQ